MTVALLFYPHGLHVSSEERRFTWCSSHLFFFATLFCVQMLGLLLSVDCNQFAVCPAGKEIIHDFCECFIVSFDLNCDPSRIRPFGFLSY